MAALTKGGFLLGPQLHIPRAERPFKTHALLCGSALEMQGKQRVVSLPTQIDNIVVGLQLDGGRPLGRQPRTLFAVQRVEKHTSFGHCAWRGLLYPLSSFLVSFLNLIAMRLR